MIHDSRIRVAVAGWEFESWGFATLAPCIVQTCEISAPQKYTCGTATRNGWQALGEGWFAQPSASHLPHRRPRALCRCILEIIIRSLCARYQKTSQPNSAAMFAGNPS